MVSVLVIANTDKSISFFNENMGQLPNLQYEIKDNIEYATQNISKFDVLIFYGANNSDDDTKKLIFEHCNNVQIIVVQSKENAEKSREFLTRKGIIILEKPISLKAFKTAIDVIQAMTLRFGRKVQETDDLRQQIDDIKIIDRAKCILISNINMNEEAAHKYIEKQAMDFRKSKREIALNILKTYEN